MSSTESIKKQSNALESLSSNSEGGSHTHSDSDDNFTLSGPTEQDVNSIFSDVASSIRPRAKQDDFSETAADTDQITETDDEEFLMSKYGSISSDRTCICSNGSVTVVWRANETVRKRPKLAKFRLKNRL